MNFIKSWGRLPPFMPLSHCPDLYYTEQGLTLQNNQGPDLVSVYNFRASYHSHLVEYQISIFRNSLRWQRSFINN